MASIDCLLTTDTTDDTDDDDDDVQGIGDSMEGDANSDADVGILTLRVKDVVVHRDGGFVKSV